MPEVAVAATVAWMPRSRRRSAKSEAAKRSEASGPGSTRTVLRTAIGADARTISRGAGVSAGICAWSEADASSSTERAQAALKRMTRMYLATIYMERPTEMTELLAALEPSTSFDAGARCAGLVARVGSEGVVSGSRRREP